MKWVTMWGNAQSTVLPHPTKYAKDVTLRYPIYCPFKGNKLRITLDNFCCDEDVVITKMSIFINGSKSIAVTFNKKREAFIKAHQSIISDEINLDVNENDYLIVSMYLEDYTNLSSGVDIVGPLSKGYFAYGNQLDLLNLDIKKSKATSWVYFLSNIDIYTMDDNEAIICYGDSITSQDWPDYMQIALKENNINNISVIRKAVSGSRILKQYDCITYQSYGLCGKNRFTHEVSSVSGANKIIIQHGINDIIHPVGEDLNIFRPMSDLPSVEDLIGGIEYYLEECKKMNLTPILGTLLPIYGWRTHCLDKEEIKNNFNDWIKNNNHLDFASEIGIYIDGQYHFKEGCDSGDHLHPSKYAYKLMGELAAKSLFNIGGKYVHSKKE